MSVVPAEGEQPLSLKPSLSQTQMNNFPKTFLVQQAFYVNRSLYHQVPVATPVTKTFQNKSNSRKSQLGTKIDRVLMMDSAYMILQLFALSKREVKNDQELRSARFHWPRCGVDDFHSFPHVTRSQNPGSRSYSAAKFQVSLSMSGFKFE